MFKRLKRALVESLIGAIALGWLLADAITHFVGIFTSPVAEWAVRRSYAELGAQTPRPSGIGLKYALPDLITFIALLLIWYVLLRWLYFKPPDGQTAKQAPEEGQPT